MTLVPPQPVQRLLAVLLLGLVAGAVWLGLAQPIARHFSDRAGQIAHERVVLGRFLAAGNRTTAAADMDARVKAALGAGALLAGESEAIRLAGLQTLIGDIAQRGNLRLRSIRALPRREQGRFELYGVRLQVTTDVAGAQAFLHRLETADQLLLITAVQMTRVAAGRDGGPVEVDLRLDILGVARKEPG